ncbi:MAG: tyrosine recombinase [Elusimicrobia bacterium]|nr:tyrosine recombinase [Elusimicrobiota bacterium]
MLELAKIFYRHLSVERGLSKNTCLAYAGDLDAFLLHCEKRKTDPAAAEAPFIEEYFWSLKSGKGLKASSIFRKTEALRAFYRFLLLEGKAKKDPTKNFRAPRLAQKVPRFLDRRDMEKLLSRPAGNNFARLRTAAAVDLLYSTGIRITELLTLRLESVNFQSGWLRVFGKGSKERIVPVNQAALGTLKNYLEARELKFGAKGSDAELFLNKSGRHLSRVQIWKDILNLGKEAEVSIKSHPHLFRHTFASHLVQAGADLRSVQEMLGHSSLNTTQIYTHIDKGDLKNAHNKYHPDK